MQRKYLDPRTRHLVAVLVEDPVAAVVGALADGGKTRGELMDHSGMSETTVRTVTRRLEDLGLVAGERVAPRGRGRPHRRYKLRDASALESFATAVRELDSALGRRS